MPFLKSLKSTCVSVITVTNQCVLLLSSGELQFDPQKRKKFWSIKYLEAYKKLWQSNDNYESLHIYTEDRFISQCVSWPDELR